MVSNKEEWLWQVLSVMTLQRRIVELCTQAVAEPDWAEVENILTELRIALHEHSQRLKGTLAEYPVPIPVE
jgi:hypothetical protein